MAKKVVIEPNDFKKIVDYLTSLPVPFQALEKAVEIKSILLKIRIMELEMKTQEQVHEETKN